MWVAPAEPPNGSHLAVIHNPPRSALTEWAGSLDGERDWWPMDPSRVIRVWTARDHETRRNAATLATNLFAFVGDGAAAEALVLNPPHRNSDEPLLPGQLGSLFTAGGVELRQERRYMVVDGFWRDEEAIGDLGVGETLDEELEHIDLARREAGGMGPRSWPGSPGNAADSILSQFPP